MDRHPALNEKMWTILVDWLYDVCVTFKLHDNTLFMAVHLLHTALQKLPPIPPHRLQLYGTTALFMASKYEEVCAPELRDFVYITDNSCSKDQILAIESEILALHWPIFDTLYERIINLDCARATDFALIAISRYDVWNQQSALVADACKSIAANRPATRSKMRPYGDLYAKLSDHSHLPMRSRMRTRVASKS